MSSENERHPTALSDAEKEAMKKAFPAAFDADDASAEGADDAAPADAPAAGGSAEAGQTPAAGAAPKEEPAPDPKPASGDGDGQDPAQPDAPAAAKKDDEPVSRKEFNGVLHELRETRKQLQQVKTPAEPARDFDSELKALDEKLAADQKALVDLYDEGELDAADLVKKQGELMTDYQVGVRKITVAETEQVAAAALEKQRQQDAAQSAQQAWDTTIGAWKDANADFLANPIRKKAVSDLLEQFGADETLTNEQVIAQVQVAAFEAFNWNKTTPAAPADPHAARNAADRHAAARASSDTPPVLDGGVGSRGAPGGVNLETLKPGQFSKLPRAEQEKLLGEGAL